MRLKLARWSVREPLKYARESRKSGWNSLRIECDWYWENVGTCRWITCCETVTIIDIVVVVITVLTSSVAIIVHSVRRDLGVGFPWDHSIQRLGIWESRHEIQTRLNLNFIIFVLQHESVPSPVSIPSGIPNSCGEGALYYVSAIRSIDVTFGLTRREPHRVLII